MVIMVVLNIIIINYQIGDQQQGMSKDRRTPGGVYIASSGNDTQCPIFITFTSIGLRQLFQENVLIIIVITVITRMKLKMTRMIQQLIL